MVYSSLDDFGATEFSSMDLTAPDRIKPLPAAGPEVECPFVHRADGRCAEHLTMGGMGYAFDHCFDAFAGCPVYAELSAQQAGHCGEENELANWEGHRQEDRRQEKLPVQMGQCAGTWKRLRSRVVELTVGRKRLGQRAA